MANKLFAALADDLAQLIRLHDREIDADDRLDPRITTGQGPLHGTVETIAIGDAHDRHLQFRSACGKSLRHRGAVLQRVPRDDLQMRKGVHRHRGHDAVLDAR